MISEVDEALAARVPGWMRQSTPSTSTATGFTLVVASPVPDRFTTAELTKPVAEQLQFSNFVTFAQLSGHMGAIDNFERVAVDPPDLRVQVIGPI